MPSTDINGDVIVILSANEARRVYQYIQRPRDALERALAVKIARDLNLPSPPDPCDRCQHEGVSCLRCHHSTYRRS